MRIDSSGKIWGKLTPESVSEQVPEERITVYFLTIEKEGGAMSETKLTQMTCHSG